MSFHDFSSNPYKNIAEEPGYVHTLYFEYLAKKVILLKSYTKVHNQREKKGKAVCRYGETRNLLS